MPWKPTTDFEEEVINLQPHHDFIYGVLSEPQYSSYPRPKTHTEYAATKKTFESKERRKPNTTTSKLNGKLHAIQQVQRMACTKLVGEQPTIDDWDNNKKIEQETVGMMRYCGMGVSVEQPLNQNVTMATFPVENKIKVVQNGRRKVALFFDENVFKLKEKVSDTSTSSGFDSCNNSDSSELKNNPNDDDSFVSELETSCNNSFLSTNSTLSFDSFTTAGGDNSDSFSTASTSQTSPSIQLQTQRLHQYHKLLEDTASLSLESSNRSQKQNPDSFETAEDMRRWKPISFDDENIFEKAENWPDLSNNLNRRECQLNPALNKTLSDSADDASSVATSNTSSSSSNQARRINFLDRFIKTENSHDLNTSTASSESTTSVPTDPSTYAAITKTSKHSTAKHKEKINNSSNDIIDFQPFYTTRRMYALKRPVK